MIGPDDDWRSMARPDLAREAEEIDDWLIAEGLAGRRDTPGYARVHQLSCEVRHRVAELFDPATDDPDAPPAAADQLGLPLG